MKIMKDDTKEMSSSAHVQRRHHEKKGCLIYDVKQAKKAWIAPGQRNDYTFEIEMEAMSGEKLLFIARATGSLPVAPGTNDNNDNLSHHLNDDLVRGVVIERALAASATMEEIFQRTSSCINPQAVFESESVPLMLKHLGGGLIILSEKPHFIDLSGDDDATIMAFMVDEDERQRQRQDAPRQTEKGEQELKKSSSAEDDGEKLAWVVQVEAHVDDEMKAQAQQEVLQSSERPGNSIPEVRESSWRACQSLKLIFQVIFSNDNTANHLERQKKSWPNYTLNTLLFACTMLFSVYMNPSSSASVTIKILLVVDIVVFFVINTVHLIKLPTWGNALACISWFLLELAMCLLILPFNGCYALSILTVLFLVIIVALLQPKFQHSVRMYVLPSFTQNDGDTQGDIGDQENDYLNHLFDISNGIATCGGLVTGILGYSYMEGPVTTPGFFFICTVLLGLYLMMVIAMRAVSPPHAACLAIVLKALLLLTIITASVSFVRHSSVTM